VPDVATRCSNRCPPTGQIHRGAIVRATAIHKVRRDELGKWQISLKSHKDTLSVSSAFAQRFKAT
jgi:DNA-binding LytR/AlgR family response regulator